MSAALPADVAALVASAPGIGLEELQRTAALRTRVDRKHVVDWATLRRVLEALRDTHRVLEIDGRRGFGYESVYYDSSDLWAFRAHVQRRRRRYKVRSRHYLDSGLRTFEVKLKGRRGETVKHQMPYAEQDASQVSDDARRFVVERLAEAYPGLAVPDLAPTLRNRYHRVTLAAAGERVTCDFDLSYAGGDADVPGLDPGYVIVESKSERGAGTADRELRALGVRPVTCSKYLVGVGLLRDDVKVNDLRRLLDRYFAGRRRPAVNPTGPGRPVRA